MLKWGKNRDPGFEYPSDVRLDEFEKEEIEDNVNKNKKKGPEVSEELIESKEDEETESDQPKKKSWWSYLLPYNYLH